MAKPDLILYLLIALILCGCAGARPAAEKDTIIQVVMEIPGVKKDVIFDKSKMWIANNFRSAKAVIEYENKENGSIIGNGIIPCPCSGIECIAKVDWKLRFTMNEDIKDEKFRLSFINLTFIMPPTPGYLPNFSGGNESLVSQHGDFDTIRPVLLEYGDRIKKYIQDSKSADNW